MRRASGIEGGGAVPARAFGKAHEGCDRGGGQLFGRAESRQGGPAVDHNEAAAARAFGSAAVLGRDDAAFLAQHLQQVHSRLV